MLLTGNFNLRKPEPGEPVDVQDLNYNADIIDKELKSRTASDGNASEMTIEFETATQLTELTSNDSLKGLFGKLKLAVKKLMELIDEVAALKKSVADGKELLLSTIGAYWDRSGWTSSNTAWGNLKDMINIVANLRYNEGFAAGEAGKLSAETGTATLSITQSGGGSGTANKVTIVHSAHSKFAYSFPDRMWYTGSGNTDMISVYVEEMTNTSVTLHAVANGFAGEAKTLAINWIAYD